MIRKIGITILVVLLAVLVNKFYLQDRPVGDIITITSGKLQGSTGVTREGRTYWKYLGIPYAKPPLNELRFALPQAAEPWEGVLDASNYRSECPQFEFLTKLVTGNEDCLFLNVFTPNAGSSLEERKRKLMPVMVFIHGGYYEHGSGDLYKPTYFMDEDIVMVTFNYRINVMGFLSTGDEVVRGNMGLKDQTLALKWVRDNIAVFGGDPDQVTLFGESAGSVCVHFHMISPMSKGLFSRGIGQSGAALAHWTIYEDPVNQAKEYARRVHCDTDSSEKMLECLRSLDAATLLDALPRFPERYKKDVFVPVIEKYVDEDTFLPDTLEAMYASGRVSPIPWLTGVNSLEGLMFSVEFENNRTFSAMVKRDWSFFEDCVVYFPPNFKKQSEKIRQYYFGKIHNVDPNDHFQAVAELVSDRNYYSVITRAVDLHKKIAPVYPYWLKKEGRSFTELFGRMTGRLPRAVDVVLAVVRMFVRSAFGSTQLYKDVSHADDLIWFFEIPPLYYISTSSEHYAFSKAMIKAWVMFAYGYVYQ